MQQLTIFDVMKESSVEIIPRPGIIKNQVSIYYKGIHVANARDCKDGTYEVRPGVVYWQLGRNIQLMNVSEIEDFCESSFVKYGLSTN